MTNVVKDNFSGLLLVDKPLGWTSFDAVNLIRAIIARNSGQKPKSIKVGHIGTLDPLATGLLVILVGKDFTRRASELAKLDKTYELTMKLGQNSSTGDEEGQKTIVSDYRPSESELSEVLERFKGQIKQVPPHYSAVKVGGQRAYKLARRGQEPVLEPRAVNIKSLVLIRYKYPLVSLTAEVSSGTYIRSLAQDIGQALQTGAYLTELKRTQIGPFSLTAALALGPIKAKGLINPNSLIDLPNR